MTITIHGNIPLRDRVASTHKTEGEPTMDAVMSVKVNGRLLEVGNEYVYLGNPAQFVTLKRIDAVDYNEPTHSQLTIENRQDQVATCEAGELEFKWHGTPVIQEPTRSTCCG